jgi:hypothetical protein
VLCVCCGSGRFFLLIAAPGVWYGRVVMRGHWGLAFVLQPSCKLSVSLVQGPSYPIYIVCITTEAAADTWSMLICSLVLESAANVELTCYAANTSLLHMDMLSTGALLCFSIITHKPVS